MGSTVFYAGAEELATLTNAFAVAGVATDPTAVVLVVTDPLGVAATYNWPSPATITRTSVGVFTKDIPCTSAGTWTYLWTGTGTASDVQAGSWLVRPTAFSDLYVTPEQLKSRTGISDSLDDNEMLGVCRAISRWIDEHCDWVFARRVATMKLEACGPYTVEVPAFVSVTTVKTDADGDGVFETTWAVGDFEAQPVNAAAQLEPRPYTSLAAVGSRTFPVASGAGERRARVEVVGVFGWPALPAGVAEAAAIIAGDYLKLGGMNFGVAGYGDYGAIRARVSKPALDMLHPSRRYPYLMR
jgi:hypothetical protein